MIAPRGAVARAFRLSANLRVDDAFERRFGTVYIYMKRILIAPIID